MNDYITIIELILIVFIGLMNVYTCFLFFQDKQLARTKQYRISERKLLGTSFLLGGFGALLGMRLFRHKTKHLKFQLLIPVACVFTVIVWAWLVFDAIGMIY